MKYALALVLLLGLLSVPPLRAQAADAGTGLLFVQVDSNATLFLNGTKIGSPKFRTEKFAVTLQPGDRIVARLSNLHAKGNGYFMLLYLAPDHQSQISFRAVNFKILPDVEMTDFTGDQFSSFGHQVLVRSGSEEKQIYFPYKNTCEAVWGDRAEGAIGTLITSDMFGPLLPQ